MTPQSENMQNPPQLTPCWFFSTHPIPSSTPANSQSTPISPEEDARGLHRDHTQQQLILEKHSLSAAASGPGAQADHTNSDWQPFPWTECYRLEQAYQKLQENASADDSVVVGEEWDQVVFIRQRLKKPAYWDGPSYRVCRGTWYLVESPTVWKPIDESLAAQIESGYQKFKPWRRTSAASHLHTDSQNNSPVSAANIPANKPKLAEASSRQASTASISHEMEASPTPSPDMLSKEAEFWKTSKEAEDYPWTLFGPWAQQYVIFTGPTHGWKLKGQLAGQFTKFVYSKFTSGENLGGDRLYRGWPGKRTDMELPPTPMFKHLVFVTHGIGQRYGERTKSFSFLDNVQFMKQTMENIMASHVKGNSETVSEGLDADDTADAPVSADKQNDKIGSSNLLTRTKVKETLLKEGIFVIPVEWRKRLHFDTGVYLESALERAAKKDQKTENVLKIEDITPDGMLAVRNIISDVLIDVLLYMEPHHQFDMIQCLVSEMNRLHGIFCKHNPSFAGEIHIVAHSLGTVLTLDALSSYPLSKSPQNSKVDVTSDGLSPVDISEMRPLAGNPQSASPTKSTGESDALLPNAESILSTDSATAANLHFNFPVSKVFTLGSPVGMFLLLQRRGFGLPLKLAKEMDDHRLSMLHPDIDAIYHIFHPLDPIAYRMEPLVYRLWSKEKPSLIPTYKAAGSGIVVPDVLGSLKSAFKGMTFSTAKVSEKDETSTAGKGDASDVESVGDKSSVPVTPIPASAGAHTASNSPAKSTSAERVLKKSQTRSHEVLKGAESSPSPKSAFFRRPSNADQLPSLHHWNPRHGRIDFVINDKTVFNMNTLVPMAAHLAYWRNEDVMSFIYREITEKPSE